MFVIYFQTLSELFKTLCHIYIWRASDWRIVCGCAPCEHAAMCQHRAGSGLMLLSNGPVLAHNGMFTGNGYVINVDQFQC